MQSSLLLQAEPGYWRILSEGNVSQFTSAWEESWNAGQNSVFFLQLLPVTVMFDSRVVLSFRHVLFSRLEQL